MAKIVSISQLGLAFFGLTLSNAPEFRVALFTQIHEIVFHGQGGYDWDTIYNMPIWLRKFTFNKIDEHYRNQNKKYNDDLASQTHKIKSGKVEVAPQFLNAKNKLPKY